MPDGYFNEKYNFPRFQRVQHFPGRRGGPNFSRGGGGGFQVLISIETHITFDFPGEGVRNPYPPLDPHMFACKCKLLCNKFKTESEPHTGRCINYITRKI